MADQEQTRFRSFAERYVIERASGFKSDADAWTAVQDAMRVYKMIEQQSTHVSRQLSPTENGSQQAGAGTVMQGPQAPRGYMSTQALPAIDPQIAGGVWNNAGTRAISPDAKSRIRQLFNWRP